MSQRQQQRPNKKGRVQAGPASALDEKEDDLVGAAVQQTRAEFVPLIQQLTEAIDRLTKEKAAPPPAAAVAAPAPPRGELIKEGRRQMDVVRTKAGELAAIGVSPDWDDEEGKDHQRWVPMTAVPPDCCCSARPWLRC
jgi:hypothetical protein